MMHAQLKDKVWQSSNLYYENQTPPYSKQTRHNNRTSMRLLVGVADGGGNNEELWTELEELIAGVDNFVLNIFWSWDDDFWLIGTDVETKGCTLNSTLLISASVLDMGTEVVDIGTELLDIGIELLDIGTELLDIGTELLEIGTELLDIGIELLKMGVWTISEVCAVLWMTTESSIEVEVIGIRLNEAVIDTSASLLDMGTKEVVSEWEENMRGVDLVVWVDMKLVEWVKVDTGAAVEYGTSIRVLWISTEKQ